MESLSVSAPNPTNTNTNGTRFRRLCRHIHASLSWLFRQLAFHVHPFFHHLLYFLALAFIGSLALFILHSRVDRSFPYIDLLYMCVSALTVSGLNSIELESFSTAQLMVLTLLMLAGGEIFVSLLGVVLRSRKARLGEPARVISIADPESATVELGRIDSAVELARAIKCRCLSSLVMVMIWYLAAFHVVGAVAIVLYLRYTSSTWGILRTKGLPLLPVAISMTVSSFANGGLIPTNENMIVFLKNSGLLLIIVVLVLVGNVLFASSLRIAISVLYRITGREEYGYMLRNPEKLSFPHLQNKRTTIMVAASVGALFAAQLVVYLASEWKKGYLDGLSSFQKIASGLFQAANSRHCGESSIDVSQVSPAVSVIFTLAMFLPAYASFQPPEQERADPGHQIDQTTEKGPWRWAKIMSLPQAAYVAIFVFLICIIERKKMSSDPLNFSFLFMVFEIVSAYGNVGYSTGYACARQLNPDSTCKDMWISLSGKWSNGGKLLIMFVMLFGRLKKFHLDGGRAWKLK